MELRNGQELFGFYLDDEAVFIKANPMGLRKFANKLNDIATEWDEDEWSGVVPTDGGKHNFKWLQGELFVAAIYEVKDLHEMSTSSNYSENTRDWLFKMGCFIAIMLFLIPFFAGLQTIYNWFF